MSDLLHPQFFPKAFKKNLILADNATTKAKTMTTTQEHHHDCLCQRRRGLDSLPRRPLTAPPLDIDISTLLDISIGLHSPTHGHLEQNSDESAIGSSNQASWWNGAAVDFLERNNRSNDNHQVCKPLSSKTRTILVIEEVLQLLQEEETNPNPV